jgi:hypothetical protein
MGTENSVVPCRDGCLIQVIPSPSDAKNLSRGTRAGIPVYIRMEEPWRFHDAALVRIRQPNRIGRAALPSRMRKDVTGGDAASSSVWRSLP